MAVADPLQLFRHAEAFHDASRAIAPEPGADPERLAPYIANSVFALELYLKCLLMHVKGKYPQIHSVQALFHDLPSDEIHRVRKLHREIYRAHFPQPRQADRKDGDDAADARLEAILAGAKDAFTAARYGYESGPDAGGRLGVPDVGVAIAAVRGRILALEPAWASG